jgi:hypothetical protein
MYKCLIRLTKAYNKALILNKFNTNKMSFNGSEPQIRSIYNSTLIVSRLNFITNKKSGQQSNRSEPKTELELHFCEKISQNFSFKKEECIQLLMICKSAFDSHLISVESIDHLIEFIGNHFSPYDIYFNPQIFLIHSRTLINRTIILKELGFNHLKVSQVDSCFRQLLNETPNKLKSLNFYESHRNPLNHLLESIDCPKLLKQEIINEIKTLGEIDSISFERIRRICVAKYIESKLKTSYENALKIIDKKDSRFDRTSFSSIVLVTDFLLKKFKMPIDRLVGTSNLLTVDYNNLVTIYQNIDKIAGIGICELSARYPKLLDTKCSTLIKNIQILKKFNATDSQILSSVQVLTLNSENLENRLLLLNKSEEMKQFRDSERKLCLVVHLEKAFNRLEMFKATGGSTISLNQLIGHKRHFERLLLRYEGPKNKTAIEFYLSEFLKIDFQSIKSRIGSHPYGSRLNVSNANKIVEFFIGLGLSKEQIINGIYIALYEYELVKHQYRLMSNLTELQPFDFEWKKHPFLLQLLIYYIEKNYSFTGNGVYVMPNK